MEAVRRGVNTNYSIGSLPTALETGLPLLSSLLVTLSSFKIQKQRSDTVGNSVCSRGYTRHRLAKFLWFSYHLVQQDELLESILCCHTTPPLGCYHFFYTIIAVNGSVATSTHLCCYGGRLHHQGCCCCCCESSFGAGMAGMLLRGQLWHQILRRIYSSQNACDCHLLALFLCHIF